MSQSEQGASTEQSERGAVTLISTDILQAVRLLHGQDVYVHPTSADKLLRLFEQLGFEAEHYNVKIAGGLVRVKPHLLMPVGLAVWLHREQWQRSLLLRIHDGKALRLTWAAWRSTHALTVATGHGLSGLRQPG